MMKYNEVAAKGGRAAEPRWAASALHGRPRLFAGGKPKVTDGPFGEAKEVLGGYWMIQVKSQRGGHRMGKALPGAPRTKSSRSGRCRRCRDFPEDVQKAAAAFPEMQKAIGQKKSV